MKLLIALLFMSSSFAFATVQGTVGGGGGGAYVCSPTDVELVDLYEAETMGLHIIYDNTTPLADQITKALARVKQISPAFGADVEKIMNAIPGNLAGQNGVEIPKPKDVDEHYGKKGCPLTGMMYYDDNWNKLVRDPAIFNAQKTITEVVASYLHEAVYKVMRDQNMPASGDSVLARRIVGCAMSDKDMGDCLGLTKTTPLVQANSWNCDVVNKYGTPASFTMYGLDHGETWMVQINKYNGQDVLYQTRSVYYKEGMMSSEDTGVGQFNASPDVGRNFVYLTGMGGLGNVANRMIPWITVLDNHLTVQMPGTTAVVSCRPTGKFTPPPPKGKNCSMSPSLQRCIDDMAKVRGPRNVKLPMTRRSDDSCNIPLKTGFSCVCAKDPSSDIFTFDTIDCSPP